MSSVADPAAPARPQSIAPPPPPPPSAPSLADFRYRITVAQYQKMAESGVFGTDTVVELLEGLLVRKMTKNQPHIVATELIQIELTRAVPAGWYVSMQNPVTITDDDGEPEPDAKVVRGHPRDYAQRRVSPADSALLVEVSETSYPYDRGPKLASYARASVPIYWILDLNRRVLEVFSEPTGPAGFPYYRSCRTLGPDEEVPLVLDGREVARIAVRDLLP